MHAVNMHMIEYISCGQKTLQEHADDRGLPVIYICGTYQRQKQLQLLTPHSSFESTLASC